MSDLNLEHVLAIVGALVPLASALSSWVNGLIRNRSSSGEAVSTGLLRAAQVLNLASVNLDKVSQFGRAVKGGQLVQTALPSTQALPTEPVLEPVADVAPAADVCPTCGRAR